ncbi:hypothetical protein T03_15402 [Trichinella britovi]|uniref:Uncharacterized protein n=1 Tax=Trichinella britovi TaxID=45882 RepID=A0A0V1CBJ6_TRIBR|nr:hypothetical protein T03_15402 [Trichinella britovi]
MSSQYSAGTLVWKLFHEYILNEAMGKLQERITMIKGLRQRIKFIATTATDILLALKPVKFDGMSSGGLYDQPLTDSGVAMDSASLVGILAFLDGHSFFLFCSHSLPVWRIFPLALLTPHNFEESTNCPCHIPLNIIARMGFLTVASAIDFEYSGCP